MAQPPTEVSCPAPVSIDKERSSQRCYSHSTLHLLLSLLGQGPALSGLSSPPPCSKMLLGALIAGSAHRTQVTEPWC